MAAAASPRRVSADFVLRSARAWYLRQPASCSRRQPGIGRSREMSAGQSQGAVVAMSASLGGGLAAAAAISSSGAETPQAFSAVRTSAAVGAAPFAARGIKISPTPATARIRLRAPAAAATAGGFASPSTETAKSTAVAKIGRRRTRRVLIGARHAERMCAAWVLDRYRLFGATSRSAARRTVAAVRTPATRIARR